MPSPHPAPEPDQQTEDAQFYRRILHRLIDVGANLADEIPTHTADTPLKQTAMAYDRIARGVRHCIAQARKVVQPLPMRQTRIAARQQIIRAVEDTIQRCTEDEKAEALHEELAERLDTPELEEDLDNIPVAELIEQIVRDLGLASGPYANPWKRRTPADLADLRARAAAPTQRCAEDDRPLPGPGRSSQRFQLPVFGQLEWLRRESPGLHKLTPTPPQPPAHPWPSVTRSPPPGSPPPQTTARSPAKHDPPSARSDRSTSAA